MLSPGEIQVLDSRPIHNGADAVRRRLILFSSTNFDEVDSSHMVGCQILIEFDDEWTTDNYSDRIEVRSLLSRTGFFRRASESVLDETAAETASLPSVAFATISPRGPAIQLSPP